MTTTAIAADAVTAAHVQGFHAFIASEAKAAATDTQLEAAGAKAQLTNYCCTFKVCKLL